MSTTIDLNLSEQVCKWFDEHPLFKVAGMCEIIGADTGNFFKYRKMKVIPPKYLTGCIEIIKSYGWKEAGKQKVKQPTDEYIENLSNIPNHEKERLVQGDWRGRDVSEQIEKEIAVIRAEKIPKERDTPMGRKIWQSDQNKKIAEAKGRA